MLKAAQIYEHNYILTFVPSALWYFTAVRPQKHTVKTLIQASNGQNQHHSNDLFSLRDPERNTQNQPISEKEEVIAYSSVWTPQQDRGKTITSYSTLPTTVGGMHIGKCITAHQGRMNRRKNMIPEIEVSLPASPGKNNSVILWICEKQWGLAKAFASKKARWKVFTENCSSTESRI